MKTTQKTSSRTSTVTYTFHNENSKEIPITVHLQDDHYSFTKAAAKIQAAYRSYVVRNLVKKISAVRSEADRLEKLIQRQETVDAVRSSEKEKLRINEALMGLLLELDSVPGFNPAVRELRRRVSKRVVELQEVMDGICGQKLIMGGCWDWNWDEVMGEMEEKVCRERGGEELERFCELHLGFRCLQRFLREP